MNKDEYNYLHGYQDKKDELDQRINDKADLIYHELWESTDSIIEALSDSLSESESYAAIVQYCQQNKCEVLLGSVTLELVGLHLSRCALEIAEDELT